MAICEQFGRPSRGQGPGQAGGHSVVVTPGTIRENSMRRTTAITTLALFLKGKKAGLCFADVSTGTSISPELNADKTAPAQLIWKLCRYHPTRSLMNQAFWTAAGDGVHQKEHDLFGGADRRGTYRALAASTGKPVWPRLDADHQHCRRQSCTLCHGSASGIPPIPDPQGRRASENDHQLQQRHSSYGSPR